MIPELSQPVAVSAMSIASATRGRDPMDAEFHWHKQGMHGNNKARATCMLDELQFRRVRGNRFGNERMPDIDELFTGGSGDLRPSASLRVPGYGVHPIAGHPRLNLRSLPESSPYER